MPPEVEPEEGKPSRPKLHWFSPLACAAIVGFALLLNFATPLIADDFGNTEIFGSTRPVRSFGELLASVQNYYRLQGGRVISQFLQQSFTLLGKPAFNVLNSFALLAVVILVYYHANAGRRRPSLLLGIPLLLWFALPAFGQDVLWLTGSVNYLWPMIWVLGALLPYNLYASGRLNVSHPRVLAVLLCPLAFAAGISNENVGPTLVLLFVGFIVLHRSQGRSIPGWAWAGVGGALVGAIVMLTAPGNAVRSLAYRDGVRGFAVRILVVTHVVFLYDLFVLLAIALALGVIVRSRHTDESRLAITLAGMYAAAAVVATYAMAIPPEFSPRAWMGITVFAVTALGILFAQLDFEDETVRNVSRVVLTCAVLAFFVQFAYVYTTDIRVTESQWVSRVAYIRAQESAGHFALVVPAIVPRTNKNAMYDLADLMVDPSAWPNPDIAHYYGLRSIRASAKPASEPVP